MTLHCNVISHWLGAYMKWSLWLWRYHFMGGVLVKSDLALSQLHLAWMEGPISHKIYEILLKFCKNVCCCFMKIDDEIQSSRMEFDQRQTNCHFRMRNYLNKRAFLLSNIRHLQETSDMSDVLTSIREDWRSGDNFAELLWHAQICVLINMIGSSELRLEQNYKLINALWNGFQLHNQYPSGWWQALYWPS